MNVFILKICLYVLALYIGVKLVIYYLDLPRKRQSEILWKNKLIKDLLELSKTDEIAKELVTRSKLDEFQICESEFQNRKSLRKYYRSLSNTVCDILKCKFISHDYVSAEEVIETVKKCKESNKNCENCMYNTYRMYDYFNHDALNPWNNSLGTIKWIHFVPTFLNYIFLII